MGKRVPNGNGLRTIQFSTFHDMINFFIIIVKLLF